ncbi:MAG: hypothetical protein JXA77_09580 [Bacteroidales bacterium]|nr:hypothetical protein [Bacteroidales bacterium]MBN2817420.1 hypothetical protein [Bacteroidales bacterium]
MYRNFRKWGLCVLYCLLFIGSAVQAGNFQFKIYIKQDGLSSNTITSIVQDKNGFIWIGSENGLSRFDGYNFMKFFKSSKDSASICNNHILGMYVDSKGQLWIGTPFGISRYNYSTNSFLNYYYLPDSDITLHSVNRFYESEDGHLYCISTEGQIFRYSESKNNFNLYRSFNFRSVTVEFENKNEIWIGHEHGLLKYNIQNATVNPNYTETQQARFLAGKNIYCLHSQGDNLWIGTIGDGLFRLNKNTGEYKQYGVEISSVYSITQDSRGNLWVGEGYGLYKYNPETDNFSFQTFPFVSESETDHATITCIFEDNQNNFWLGVKYKGLAYMFKNKNFQNIMSIETEKPSLSKEVITTVYSDEKNDLIAGFFYAGIDIFESLEKPYSKRFFDAGYGLDFPLGSVFQIFRSSAGVYYLATQQSGLRTIDLKTGHTKKVQASKAFPELSNCDLRAIDEDSKGRLWLAPHGLGLICYDPKSEKIKHYVSNPLDTTTLTNNWTFDILADTNDDIWVAAAYGLSRVSNDGTIRQYLHFQDDTNSLCNSFLNILYKDSKHRIWIGTIEGLNLYDRENDNFRQFSQANGYNFNGQNILGILEGSKGEIWISTNEGISRFEPETGEIHNFIRDDGFSSNEFLRNACYKTPQGELLFGNTLGIVKFFPDSIYKNLTIPPVYITSVKLFNHSIIGNNTKLAYGNKDFQKTRKITLDYESNVITFEYTALNYINSQKNNYAYMLEGFDKDWHYVGSKRDVTYTNLDPGNYIFRVKASNNDNVWNEEGAYLELIILPPFWKTILFRVIISLLVIGLMVLIIYLREHQVKVRNRLLEELVDKRTKELIMKSDLLAEKAHQVNQKNKQLKELNEMKDRFFSIIAHDLKNPIGTITTYTKFLNDNFEDLSSEEIKTNIGQIHTSLESTFDLLSSLLEWGSTQSGMQIMKKEEVKICPLIKSALKHFEEFASSKDLSIKFTEISPEIKLKVDKNMISSVVRNLISNAIKFSKHGGEIFISCTYDESNLFTLTVKDEGLGMSEEQLNDLFLIDKVRSTPGSKGEIGNGFGLLLSKDYIEKHNGTITVESEINKGSVFKVTLPIVH